MNDQLQNPIDLELAQEIVTDHARHPHHVGELTDATHQADATNASCGDKLNLQLKIEDNKISKVAITPCGCVISTAASSLLTDWLIDKSIDEAKAIDEQHIKQLLGIPINITRAKCANLPLRALHQALQ